MRKSEGQGKESDKKPPPGYPTATVTATASEIPERKSCCPRTKKKGDRGFIEGCLRIIQMGLDLDIVHHIPEAEVGVVMSNRHFSFVILLLFFFLVAASGDSKPDDCVYTLYVKTGSIIKAGTDSKISITLGDANGKSVSIPDLEQWGLMGPNYDYYERGNQDIFTVRAPCVGAPLCQINVTSDGSGAHHGWYCDYVEVTLTGPHKACSQTIFYVDQWLAKDAPPYKLTAILDGCSQLQQKKANGPFVVTKHQQQTGVAAAQ
ncbi:Plat domain-containing protein [Thalictrum thalictroides]|uniref:Plat domain-containing protein n=1 Tax=Thalictrum thalictroides TaxID=46969 RepID=A0A7J6VW65_THATH|nr:Plat domain-containing protein [Thalictrum thalictroides]